MITWYNHPKNQRTDLKLKEYLEVTSFENVKLEFFEKANDLVKKDIN
jgi:hypothetical protein